MPFEAHMKIDDLIDKKVRRIGFFVSDVEHGHGMPERCSLEPIEGKLEKVNYKKGSGEIDSIVIEAKHGTMKLSFNSDSTGRICGKEIYLYSNGKLVYESWGEDSERADKPDDKRS